MAWQLAMLHNDGSALTVTTGTINKSSCKKNMTSAFGEDLFDNSGTAVSLQSGDALDFDVSHGVSAHRCRSLCLVVFKSAAIVESSTWKC